MDWLRKLFRRRAPREALLNEGLTLAMDWGEDWLSPIDNRLRERHPYLRADELANINDECQHVMRWGHELVHVRLQDAKGVDADDFARRVSERHPWIDQENMARLLTQSTYYAAKTGGYARDTSVEKRR